MLIVADGCTAERFSGLLRWAHSAFVRRLLGMAGGDEARLWCDSAWFRAVHRQRRSPKGTFRVATESFALGDAFVADDGSTRRQWDVDDTANALRCYETVVNRLQLSSKKADNIHLANHPDRWCLVCVG
ncbi:hypothetical protein BIW11_03762 [Tropilaelaps mercedesae]|uniref:Uncharacterized protein n=1 Tax=Tropilaelaps mercedesae TaxID=418985 RepID=A0A1V9XGK6_9ACAR|nr:hypothetical protein BIW11_03762 [Tropilaelaps mercedesae]